MADRATDGEKVAAMRPATADKLQDATRMIREGRAAGIFVGAITLFVVVLNAMTGSGLLGLRLWNLIDVVVVGALTFGVHRRGRAAAVLLFAYFVGSEVLRLLEGQLTSDDSTGRLIFAAAFGLFLFQGVRGTFAYHRWSKDVD